LGGDQGSEKNGPSFLKKEKKEPARGMAAIDAPTTSQATMKLLELLGPALFSGHCQLLC
jgi:hypothetical protein